MVNGLNLLFQFLDSAAGIVLAATGLAIIFGIMGVINLAHGEFILVGAFSTTIAYHSGPPVPSALVLPVSMAVGVFVTVLFGIVVERTVISGAVPNWISQKLVGRDVMQPLYDRLLDSMVATWGISLIMVQGARVLFGNSLDNIPTPLGTVRYAGGEFSQSEYNLVLVGMSVLVLLGLYVLFTKTGYGMRARAVIQNEEMAESLGVDTSRTHVTTFAIGSGLAGLTGALYAPVVTMVPGLGGAFLVDAFVAVVVGGTSVVVGTGLASGLLGGVDAVVTNLNDSTTFGTIAMLIAAILLIRFLPEGMKGLVDELRRRRAEES
jgi:branched-chain amino acid transport system permease protein